MEIISANTLGKTRRAILNGREYIVAPATLLVPGVLQGSKGRLYYPPDEVAKDPSQWNGMPLVGYHPILNGQHVSGRDPDILEKQGLGFFYRATANGKLSGEAWFDVLNTVKFDEGLAEGARILPRLEREEKIELSTGLYTENIPSSGTYNGKEYDAEARNYRPDHVAVLPDQKGACSIADGCGILVNQIGLKVATGNAGVNQPHSKVTGYFKHLEAGTGKGETHEAAQRGAMVLTVEDTARGALAKVAAEAGYNPPGWVDDEDEPIWELAKAAADKGGYSGDTYWAVVSHIFRNMGGQVSNQKDFSITTDTNNKLGESSMLVKLSDNERKTIIDHLVANCNCWKHQGDGEVLNKLTDDKLTSLKAAADKEVEHAAVANAALKGFHVGKATLVFNAAKGAFVVRNDDGEECDPDDEECLEMVKDGVKNKKEEAKVDNQQSNTQKVLTANEWIQSAPAEIQSVLQNAMRIEKREREILTGRLRQIADNTPNPRRKSLILNKLDSKPALPLGALQEVLDLVDEPAVNQGFWPVEPTTNYVGASGGPQFSRLTENEQADILDLESARSEYDPLHKKGVG